MSRSHLNQNELPPPVQTPTDKRFVDLSGKRYGKLLVRYYVGKRGGQPYWLCQCDCGQYTVVYAGSLRRGATNSCGCLAQECAKSRGTHRMTGTAEYCTWTRIIQRCTDTKYHGYHKYGGRGISICGRWRQSFEAFLEDIGPRPTPKHSIDRIDNDGNYEPGNCRWATAREQANNRRTNRLLTVDGETWTVAQWAERTGLPDHVIRTRLHRGWTPRRAITTMPRTPRQITIHGTTMSIGQWAARLNVPPSVIYGRLRLGWPVAQVLTGP